MKDTHLPTLLGVSIVPAILETLHVEDPEDINRFYRSELYALLSDSDTAMWHLSPALLAQLYNEELETGSFDVPEEQS